MDSFKMLSEAGFYVHKRSGTRNIEELKLLIKYIKPYELIVTRLRPCISGGARPNTLSSRYGLEAFPIHTDFAGWTVPPRYVALFCPVARAADTNIYNGDALLCDYLQTGLFRVNDSINKSLYSNFRTHLTQGIFYRFNKDIMEPIDDCAREIVQIISSAKPVSSVRWKESAWVIFDNWRMLHSRAAVATEQGWLWRLGVVGVNNGLGKR